MDEDELDPDLVLDDDDDDARARPIHDAMQTAEIDTARDRRATVLSPIPEQLAEAMAPEGARAQRHDAVTPVALPILDSGAVPSELAAALDSDPDPAVTASRHQARQRIDEARAAMDAGNLATAVIAADAALREADEAPAPGIADVIEPARPFLTTILATYVGSTSGLPIPSPRAEAIAAGLGERERALLRRIDGQRTLADLFDGTAMGSMDVLRVVARLIKSGAIHIV